MRNHKHEYVLIKDYDDNDKWKTICHLCGKRLVLPKNPWNFK